MHLDLQMQPRETSRGGRRLGRVVDAPGSPAHPGRSFLGLFFCCICGLFMFCIRFVELYVFVKLPRQFSYGAFSPSPRARRRGHEQIQLQLALGGPQSAFK